MHADVDRHADPASFGVVMKRAVMRKLTRGAAGEGGSGDAPAEGGLGGGRPLGVQRRQRRPQVPLQQLRDAQRPCSGCGGAATRHRGDDHVLAPLIDTQ